MEIKTCPHCMGAATLMSSYSYKMKAYFVVVKCDICGAQGKAFISEEEPAAVNWNNRACAGALEAWNMRNGRRENNAEENK